MNVTKVPTSGASLNRFIAQAFASQDVVNWNLAAVVYAWTTNDDFTIDKSAVGGFTAAPGFSDAAKVYAYREAYEVAISEGLVKPVFKGDEIVIPTVRFTDYVEGSQWKIKARQQAKSKARSRQQENLERDGHKPGVAKPTPASKRQNSGPRVATVKERGERIVQELRAQVKQEQDVGRKAIWEATLSVALNALNSYTKANA